MQSARKQPVKAQITRVVTKKAPRGLEQLSERMTHPMRNRGSQAKVAKEVRFHAGIDLGEKKSNYCFLDEKRNIFVEGTLAMIQAELSELFSSIPKCRIAIEVGTHSHWVWALLESHGHQVIVANPRKVESIHKNRRKNDKVDARTLARLVRADPEFMYPIHHRGIEARHNLVLLRARGRISGSTNETDRLRARPSQVRGGMIADLFRRKLSPHSGRQAAGFCQECSIASCTSNRRDDRKYSRVRCGGNPHGQAEISGDGMLAAGTRGWTDCLLDLYPDVGKTRTIRKEPGCRMLFGIRSAVGRIRGNKHAAAYYQDGRQNVAAVAGKRWTVHSGTVRRGLRSAAIWFEAGRARREER
jgi:hypothetical protein